MDKSNAVHILFLTKWYPTAADPMLGLFVKKHALAATAAGYRVTVVYLTHLPHPQGKQYDYHAEGLLSEHIYHLPDSRGIKRTSQLLLTWEKAMQAFVSQEGKPDIIHAHVLTRHGLLALWLGVGWHIPYIITEHWSRYYPENFQFSGAMRKAITRWVVKKAAAVTVVSNRLVRSMHATGLNFDPLILPNVVDNRLFKPSLHKSNPKTIVSITCFEEKSKNLNLLLRAFKKLHPLYPEVKLQLIGEGADLEWTKERVESLGLQQSVIFSGLLQGETLAKTLSGAACLAISSNYETFAIVAFEALSCGIPVVATNVADLALHLKPEWGDIVSPGDENALFEKLLRVVESPNAWPKADMHAYIDSHFSEKAVAKILDQLYVSVLKVKR